MRKPFSKEHQPNNKMGGRKPLIVKHIIIDLEEQGIVEVSKEEVKRIYKQLLNLTKDKVEQMANDESMPIILRTIAKNLDDAKMSMGTIEMMLDRADGKPKQETDITTGGDKITDLTIKFIDGMDSDKGS